MAGASQARCGAWPAGQAPQLRLSGAAGQWTGNPGVSCLIKLGGACAVLVGADSVLEVGNGEVVLRWCQLKVRGATYCTASW